MLNYGIKKWRDILDKIEFKEDKKIVEYYIGTGEYETALKEIDALFLKIKEFIKRYPYFKIIFEHQSDEFKIEYGRKILYHEYER